MPTGRPKPNEPCPCGSDKKHKKCCGNGRPGSPEVLCNAVCRDSDHTHLLSLLRLIKASSDLDKCCYDGFTPLFLASSRGMLWAVSQLIEAGADADKAADFECESITPLFIACDFDFLAVVTRLIEAGADVNKAKTDTGWTPLGVASEKGNLTVVSRLIVAGADVDQAATISHTTVRVDTTLNNGTTPLYIAAQNDHLAVVSLLIEAGADVDKATTDDGYRKWEIGCTPLIVAIQHDRLKIVSRLIEAGADVEKAKGNGSTPLFVASQKGSLAIVSRLIEAGADVDEALVDQDMACFTPMMCAFMGGHLLVVSRLIEAGADVNKAFGGVTPLCFALSRREQGIAKQLIRKGAKMFIDGDGGGVRPGSKTAKTVMPRRGSAEAVRLQMHLELFVDTGS